MILNPGCSCQTESPKAPTRATRGVKSGTTCEIQASRRIRCREPVRFGERFVGGDGDRGALLSLGENLEKEFGAAPVEFHIAQFVKADQVDAAVAGDQLGQLPLVGGL